MVGSKLGREITAFLRTGDLQNLKLGMGCEMS